MTKYIRRCVETEEGTEAAETQNLPPWCSGNGKVTLRGGWRALPVGCSDWSPAHPFVPRTTVTCGLLQPHTVPHTHSWCSSPSRHPPLIKEGRRYSRRLVQKAEPLGGIGPGSLPGSDRPQLSLQAKEVTQSCCFCVRFGAWVISDPQAGSQEVKLAPNGSERGWARIHPGQGRLWFLPTTPTLRSVGGARASETQWCSHGPGLREADQGLSFGTKIPASLGASCAQGAPSSTLGTVAVLLLHPTSGPSQRWLVPKATLGACKPDSGVSLAGVHWPKYHWRASRQTGGSPWCESLEKGLKTLHWFGLIAKSCLTLTISWTIAHQAPPSMAFSRQEYWSDLPFPSPGDLPEPRIEPRSPALQADSLPWVIREALKTVERT